MKYMKRPPAKAIVICMGYTFINVFMLGVFISSTINIMVMPKRFMVIILVNLDHEA
ncbi:hypothetical protein D3C74_459890 [compost metagenome]